MILFLIPLLKKGYREYFPDAKSHLLILFHVLISVLVYRFTWIALKGETRHAFVDQYFRYLLVGEIFLMPLMSLIGGAQKALKEAMYFGMFDFYLAAPRSSFRLLVFHTLSIFPWEALRGGLVLVVVFLFFREDFGVLPLSHLLVSLGISGLAVFLFLGTGLLGTGLVINFRRGGNGLSHLGNLLYILAGAYFPTHVFPGWFSDIANSLPFTLYLNTIREVLDSGFHLSHVKQVALMLAWGGVLMVLSYLVFERGLRRYRQKGMVEWLPVS